MREILFKAKQIDNGEWIEGSLIDLDIDSGYCYIVQPYKKASILPIIFLITDRMKYGNKIWENDILMAHLDESYPENVTYETVEWNVAGWVGRETDSIGRQYLDKFDLEHYEVVGNIFDNPELLQEEH